MAKNPRMAVLDFASREAKRSQYCSRAAVKLEQLLLKFPKVLSSLQKGKVVKCVDLGCHPGSWLQVLSRKIKKAEIYGFDLNEIESLESLKYVDVHRTRTFQCDVFESDELMNSLQLDKNVNLLTSDMMAKTTGQNDASASHELAVRAFELATKDLLARVCFDQTR